MWLVQQNLEPRLPCREHREASDAETEVWRGCQRSGIATDGNVQFAARGQMSSVNDAAGVQRQLADDHLRLVVETMPTQAWSVRSDASIEFVNQPWLDYIGLSAEQATDWDWKVAIHPDDLSRILEVFQAALTSRQQFEVEGRLRRCDGEFRWFLFRGSPLRDQSGKVVKWFGTNTDIENRKHAEESLRSSEKNFRH
jgi:PAS domain S-box-containing protein